MVQPNYPGFSSKTLKSVHVNKNSVHSHVDFILKNNIVSSPKNYKVWLLRALSMIDLTTLSGDDTKSNVTRLCVKAAYPLSSEDLKQVKDFVDIDKNIHTAAVCVYPSRVKDAAEVINRMGLANEIQVASVATAFPAGLCPLYSRVQEIKSAIADGATEIDVVLDRSLVLSGQWDAVYEEVKEMRLACKGAHLKVILGVGELGSYENVYKASMVSMYAGADFIKTSTGKESVNATLPVGLVMCRAIRNFYLLTGKKVGLKPAGGIKTARDAVNWLVMVYTELGKEWMTPQLFRIGASSLLDVIIEELYE
ncbi:deoxyribose-phosphate aldolase [Ostrinia nubilalis]|uniref:deoxyribose-phosphate aldolase n=1 Tax=Ostrinia nubilalis TaxID=29057 RepID=UPI0030825E12